MKNLDVVKPNWVSLANANQRTGRAGRTQPGVCFRLYSRIRESTFAPQPVAEMKKTRLEELILRIKMLTLGKVSTFFQNVPESPQVSTVQISLDPATSESRTSVHKNERAKFGGDPVILASTISVIQHKRQLRNSVMVFSGTPRIEPEAAW